MEASSGAGGAGGRGGGGLARFRSAPATWLDALLEDDDPLKSASGGPTSSGNLTQLLTAGTTTTTSSSSYSLSAAADLAFFDSGGGGGSHQHNFHRQNSSPAEFLSNIDGGGGSGGGGAGYFSNFAMSGNYDFLAGSQMEVSASVSPTAAVKRTREAEFDLPSQLKGEPSSLLDLEMDKLLEDSVPCRLRAKRGCATHPRSIAERVRRTRISDRIRKLQELVPNMDKQTNTADMLEEAVEYVKRLQMQIEELTELQKNCTCIAKE